MIANKWIHFALGVALVVVGYAATQDWSSLIDPKTGGTIVVLIGIAKTILSALQPGTGQSVTATGGSIITHT